MSKANEVKGVRTWIEIDRTSIAQNYKTFRSLVSSDTKLCGVVKSNAYGHGLVPFSKELVSLGIDFLAVDSIVEAICLRQEGISTPILVLGYTLPERLVEAEENNISITVSSFELLQKIIGRKESNAPLRIHIKVDTGMLRQGFRSPDRDKLLDLLSSVGAGAQIEGLYTHFASAKNKAFPEDTQRQLREFKEWRLAFKDAGLSPMTHSAATAGALLYDDSHFDMCRIGIGMYGLWPSHEARALLEDKVRLHPALSWKTIISEVKKARKGERVGYDLTETLERDSRIAICPIGYWHGYPRRLSSTGKVLVRGTKCKVLGRVSMDILTIDVTDVPDVSVRDEVVLIGGQGSEEVSIYDMALLDEASWYETITRINPLIRRIYK